MPTYGERFFFEDETKPNLDLGLGKARLRVSFRQAGYSGSPLEINAYGDQPIIRETQDSGGNIYEPLLGQKVTFRLRAEIGWQVSSLFSGTDRTWQVVIQKDSTNTGNSYQDYWWGWLVMSDISYDYAKKPFEFVITASCGLATLKTRPLLSPSGKRLTGKVALSQVLRSALALTDLSLPLTTAVNLYNTSDVAAGQTVNGYANPNRDPLYQTLIDADAFVDEKNQPLMAYDVIKNLLTAYGMQITQQGGRWFAVRVDEKAGGWDPSSSVVNTIHGRSYPALNSGSEGGTAAPTAHQSYDLTVPVAITDSRKVKQGAKEGQLKLLPGVKVEQSYGRFVNKLPNGDFSQTEPTDSTLSLGWTRGTPLNTQSAYVLGSSGNELDPRRFRINGSVLGLLWTPTPQNPALIMHLSYDPASPDSYLTYKRTLKGRFRVQNLKAANIAVMATRGKQIRNPMTGAIQLLKEPGFYLLQDQGRTWLRNPSPKQLETGSIPINHYTTFQGQQKPKKDWATINFEMDPLGEVLDIYIFLMRGVARDIFDSNGVITGPDVNGPPAPYIEYADMRLEVEQADQNITGAQITYIQPGQVVQPDSVAKLVIGDTPDPALPNSHVATTYNRQIVPTVRWYRPDSPDYVNGNSLLGWVARSYAKQLMQSASSLEGTVLGEMVFGPLSVLLVSDIQRTISAVTGRVPFVFTRWQEDVKAVRTTGTLAELLTATTYAPPGKSSYWETPDGDVLIENDPDGNPIEPSLPVTGDGLSGIRDLVNDAIKLNGLVQLPALDGHIYQPQATGPVVEVYSDNKLQGTFRAGFLKLVQIAIAQGGGGG